MKGARGRGGHRIKKSNNARIQALYYRKHALKQHYKAVAILQREALAVLADKSLKSLADDPNFHTTIPEFDETNKALEERYEQAIDKLETERRVKADYAQKQFEMNQEYANKQYEVSNPSCPALSKG